MKKILTGMNVALALLIINTWAEPGGTYTLTGEEKGLTEIIKSDMAKYPDLYKGESLNNYITKFKKENRIGKRKLSPGDQLQFPETTASLKAKKGMKTGKGQTEQLAEIYCKRKSDKFRDGAKAVTGQGSDVEFINVSPKYKDMKVTQSVYKSTEPIEFEVRKAGLVMITFHDGGLPTKEFITDGWKKIEKIHVYDNNGTADQNSGGYTEKFILLGKYYDVGSYQIGGETFWGGVHLLH